MPITRKGEVIKKAMEKEYGSKKGESVFYASKNKGVIKGVEGKSKAIKHKLHEKKESKREEKEEHE